MNSVAIVVLVLGSAIKVIDAIDAIDNCSRYYYVVYESSNCTRRLFNMPQGSSGRRDEFLERVIRSCRSIDSVLECIEDMTEGCSNQATIISDVRSQMNICTGTEPARWVTNYVVPAINRVSQSCEDDVDAELSASSCVATMRSAFQVLNENTTVEDGLAIMKRIIDVTWDCLKELTINTVRLPPSCEDTSSTDVFLSMALHISRHPILGMHLRSQHIQELMNLARRQQLETDVLGLNVD